MLWPIIGQIFTIDRGGSL